MIRLFNMDVHHSVIEDVKHVLTTLYPGKFEVTEWCMAFRHSLFNKPYTKPDIINESSWRNMDETTIERFLEKYGAFIGQFDGFIVTHSPIFALIFERFNKPILIVNSTRYEQPYSFVNKIKEWEQLNRRLLSLSKRPDVAFVSNNKADQSYLKKGAGVDSVLIPSLCLYTKAMYNPTRNTFLVFNDISKTLCSPYKWEDLYSFKGIIHYPYEISTMSISEQYSANIPLLFPSKEYMKRLVLDGMTFNPRYTKICGNFGHPDTLSYELDYPTYIDFWVENADYYDENMKHVVYFHSTEHLDELVQTLNTSSISSQMEAHNRDRVTKAMCDWTAVLNRLFLDGKSHLHLFAPECDFSSIKDGDVLHVQTKEVHRVARMLNKIGKRLTLVSEDTDLAIPDGAFSSFLEFAEFLTSDLLIKWYFRQACTYQHEKLVRLPVLEYQDHEWPG
jgi:hypothetical protein